MRKESSLEKELMVGSSSSRRRGCQRKRWMAWILANAGISLAETAALCRNRASGDSSFIESAEVGDDLTAYSVKCKTKLVFSADSKLRVIGYK